MLFGKMRARLRIWLAVALCVAVFFTFLVHKPACSSSNMLHNKHVHKFKALTVAKGGIEATVEFTLKRPVAASVSSPMETPAAVADAPMLEAPGCQVLSCCFLC